EYHSALCPMSQMGHKRTLLGDGWMSALCQQQTFRPLVDIIDGVPRKALKFAGHHHEITPETISASNRRRWRAAGYFARRKGRHLSVAAGALHRWIPCRQRIRRAR